MGPNPLLRRSVLDDKARGEEWDIPLAGLNDTALATRVERQREYRWQQDVSQREFFIGLANP